MKQLHVETGAVGLIKLYKSAKDAIDTDGVVEISVDSEPCVKRLTAKLKQDGFSVERVRKLNRLIVREEFRGY